MNIIPLEKMAREDVRDMAHAAVNNGIPHAVANTFPAGCVNRAHFEHDYIEYDRELASVD